MAKKKVELKVVKETFLGKVDLNKYWIYVKILDTKRLSFFLHKDHSGSVPHPK